MLAGGYHHGVAHGSRAALVPDVGFILVGEILDRGKHGLGTRLTQSAKGAVLDRPGDLAKNVQVAHPAFALGDPRQDIEHVFGAKSAGRTLSTGFGLGEGQEEAGHIHHARVFIHHDHAARSHDGADLLQGAVVDGQVQVLLGYTASGGTAHLYGLEFPSLWNASPDTEDHLPHGRADGHFHQTGVVDLAREREDLGPLAFLGAHLCISFRAVTNDEGYVGKGFHIVDVRGTAVQTALGREGRPRPGHAPLSLDGGQQRGLLSAYKGAGSLFDLEMEGEVRAENVVAQQAQLLAVLNGFAQVLHGQRVFGPGIDIALVRADCKSADDHSLHHEMRVPLEEGAVHERPGVALIGVADQVFRVPGRGPGEPPLAAGGKAGAASTPNAGILHLVYDLISGHAAQHLGQRGVTTAADVVHGIRGINQTVVPQDPALLFPVKRNLMVIDDLLACLGIHPQQTFHHLVLHQGLFHNLRHVLFRDLTVQDLAWKDHTDRTLLAEAMASGDLHVYVPGQVPLFEFLQECLFHRPGARSRATGAAA